MMSGWFGRLVWRQLSSATNIVYWSSIGDEAGLVDGANGVAVTTAGRFPLLNP